MKKRGGMYCSAINTDGYSKGHHCCAKAMIEGPDGKGYCRAHYADVARQRIAALEAMIDTFVADQQWADASWKAEPHIAPLFSDAARSGK